MLYSNEEYNTLQITPSTNNWFKNTHFVYSECICDAIERVWSMLDVFKLDIYTDRHTFNTTALNYDYYQVIFEYILEDLFVFK